MEPLDVISETGISGMKGRSPVRSAVGTHLSDLEVSQFSDHLICGQIHRPTSCIADDEILGWAKRVEIGESDTVYCRCFWLT